MRKTWLLIDTNYLCYRAWFSVGHLSHEESSTGVIFGVLKDIIVLQDRFQPDVWVFCFDSKTSLRRVSCPQYKSNRGEKDPELMRQINVLRREHLQKLGYRNILCQRGYEADDCIAKVLSDNSGRNLDFITVTGDSDLYQLLGRRSRIYLPRTKQLYSSRQFEREWGVSPSQWIDVKSIAGCKTDCIQGIQGVAEKTACKFINGTLPTTTKSWKAIVEGNKIWERNRELIELPLSGIESFEICETEKVIPGDWEMLADKLGFKSIRNNPPVANKRKGFGLK